jgi:uncharacterized protein
MALFYLDASALVKLIREESGSFALRAFVAEVDLVSSELALAEVPRAIRRAVAHDPSLPVDVLAEQTAETLGAVAMQPIDRDTLIGAGQLPEPALRALDAIHAATALALSPLDGFVTYDKRQGAAARLSGLRTVTPTAGEHE